MRRGPPLGISGSASSGVGALLTPVLADADTGGIACYHTSDPANVDYYRQHGFQVTQPATEAFTAGPRYIAMSRPPVLQDLLPGGPSRRLTATKAREILASAGGGGTPSARHARNSRSSTSRTSKCST